MTNAEKFREVFHVEPTRYSVPWSCDGVLCKNCSYYNGGCDASQWWNEEYKELDYIVDLSEKVLDKIRAEIETKYGQCDICKYFEDYDYEENDISEYRSIGNIADILQIIDKYKAGSEES